MAFVPSRLTGSPTHAVARERRPGRGIEGGPRRRGPGGALTAAEAVAAIEGGATLVVAFGVSEPPALLHAIAARARDGDLAEVRTY